MLAGRTLLLADDSVTIQKVVELTFADEGVTVVSFDNGRDAIDALEEVKPDVVLADIFMPQASGFEVCEHIKQNEKLKHIPVMLLVGSFEPFDEAEARRVGADEILTKPFQSIRGLLEKVGILTGDRVPEEIIPTAELPHQEPHEAPTEKLSDRQLEMTTADTKPLPHGLELPTMDEQQMETKSAPTSHSADALLELGDFEPASASAVDDFELDVDLDDVPEYAPRPTRAPSFASAQSGVSTASAAEVEKETEATPEQLAKTQEFHLPTVVRESFEVHEIEPLPQSLSETMPSAPTSPQSSSATVSAEQLSPEVIDAIARRAVEQLSERVVQEIAWEVVPQLAELMIKRQLEEKNS